MRHAQYEHYSLINYKNLEFEFEFVHEFEPVLDFELVICAWYVNLCNYQSSPISFLT